MPNSNAKKTRPKTGDPRSTRQPFSVDLMPMDVLESIKRLRAKHGMSWPEIERLSSLPYSANWEVDLGKHGFVNWDEVPRRVLEKFPELRLPRSNLHRWYDVRVEQAKQEVFDRAVQAREIAQEFAKAGIEGDADAVINGARDVIFGLLQAGDDKMRVKASAGLIALADVMNGANANKIKERKVAVDERRIAQLEKDAALKRKRMEQETERVAKKLSNGELGEDDINRLRERVFGLPPIAKAS